MLQSWKLFVLLLIFTQTFGQNSLPNIVVILTDDLDLDLAGQEPLNKTRAWVNSNGVTFNNAFAATPICCPSRSSILTGLYPHNHGARDSFVEGGCSSPEWQAGPEKQTFATYAKGAGYLTFYAGKYLNQYGFEEAGGVEHVPDGWDFWVGLVGNSKYYDYELSVNGVSELHGSDYDKDYLTDVLGRKADDFLDFYFDQVGANLPFLMMISTPAPHSPYTPAPQYQDRYPDALAPRTPAFNWVEEDEGANPKHWVINQDPRPLPDDMLELVDEYYRDRMRSLLSVDDLVDGLLSRLEATGALANTFVVLTSDHGYHLGQFCVPREKRSPYDFDIRIPLSVSGPGVRRNVEEDALVTLVDLAPTIMDMAGVAVPGSIDGNSFLPWLLEEAPATLEQRSFLVEYTGEETLPFETCGGVALTGVEACEEDFGCKCNDARNNTYACIRFKFYL